MGHPLLWVHSDTVSEVPWTHSSSFPCVHKIWGLGGQVAFPSLHVYGLPTGFRQRETVVEIGGRQGGRERPGYCSLCWAASPVLLGFSSHRTGSWTLVVTPPPRSSLFFPPPSPAKGTKGFFLLLISGLQHHSQLALQIFITCITIAGLKFPLLSIQWFLFFWLYPDRQTHSLYPQGPTYIL